MIIEKISKIYIFIQPFVILLGSSSILLEANSTLTQISLSFNFQLRRIVIEQKSKIYIFIQPFKILLGLSRNLLEANSTLNQLSLSLTFQFRKTDKVVPTSSTNNSLE